MDAPRRTHLKKKLAPIIAIQLAVIACVDAQTTLDFANSTYTQSGSGSATVHRWAGLGNNGATSFDLVVSKVSGSYAGGGGGIVGSGFGYGRLGMPGDQNGIMNFAFVDPTNSDAAVTIGYLDFSFLDIDHYSPELPEEDADPDGRETIRFNTTTGVTGAGSPSMVVKHVGASLGNDGPMNSWTNRYVSTVNSVDNPDNPNSLTLAQRKASLILGFEDVSSFQVRFGNSETGSGRNFFFSGTSAVPEPCSILLSGLGIVFCLIRRSRT